MTILGRTKALSQSVKILSSGLKYASEEPLGKDGKKNRTKLSCNSRK